MHTPWFLKKLELDDQADERVIKRAYAKLLRTIDQASDIEGFNQLHMAYKQALAWASRKAMSEVNTAPAASLANSVAHAEPARESPEAMPNAADDEIRRALASPGASAEKDHATHTQEAVNNSDIRAPKPGIGDDDIRRALARKRQAAVVRDTMPPPRDPHDAARAAFEALRDDLAQGENATVALQRQLQALAHEHLRAPGLFELIVLEALASSNIGQRLALFNASQKSFAWLDVVHLQNLGARGHWVVQVQKEARQVETLAQRLEPALRYIDMREAGHIDPVPNQLLPLWPDLHSAIETCPRYFALRMDGATLDAWELAYRNSNMARLGLVQSQNETAHPQPMSPAQYRANRPKSGNSAVPAFGAGFAFIAFLVIRLIASMVDTTPTHTSQPMWTPPPSPPTPVASAPYWPDRPAQFQARAVTSHDKPPADCGNLYTQTHQGQWPIPRDPKIRALWAHAVQACQDEGQWLTTPTADPVFLGLGLKG